MLHQKQGCAVTVACLRYGNGANTPNSGSKRTWRGKITSFEAFRRGEFGGACDIARFRPGDQSSSLFG